MEDFDTTVLIVGGGPVGLTLSLVFAKYGVDCIVIERNASTTQHPKMDITNGRSMELFKRLGVAEKINQTAVPGDICHDVGWVSSLSGHQIYRFNYPGPDEARALYQKLNDGSQPMEPAVRISQILVEPLLRDEALASPHIDMRYGWKFIELAQDEDGVTAQIENTETGEKRQIRSQYLAGCDGGNSRVRRELGIGLSGAAKIRRRYSIHFRSDDKEIFEPWGPAWHYQSPVHGTLVNQDGKERYTLHSFLTEDEDEATVDPYDKVRPFVGQDFHFELMQAINWDNNLLVADRYRDRRVFLAGDSTHQYIPTGGYGMNTGVGDAYDLGWKLSAYINGWGGAGLLSAIEEERRPVALRNCDEAKRHTHARLAVGEVWPEDIEKDGPEGDNLRAELATKISEIGNAENESLGVELGYSYAGSSIVCNEPDDEHPMDPLIYQPTTTPGYRPPALYLADGTPIFDLFGPEFTLLNFNSETLHAGLIERAAQVLGLPLKLEYLQDNHARSIYAYDLVLIRPDQHVAWRGQEVPENISEILKKVSGN
ncbi:MAG: FAD-monooxygenase [Rhodospirillaceae bacterium]|nr:FAD-monooxygenase [Rhodospirillaceae bacterium]MBT4940804.1 FAD-monooxygenase [Rhodospirillaceae bacterium]MBT5939265.1 FAD-monooxygenase [Rhodospirillaceae bacterium]MBT7955313.1 FAD-monooxygenase [Rhodospirillaceae bacterium]